MASSPNRGRLTDGTHFPLIADPTVLDRIVPGSIVLGLIVLGLIVLGLIALVPVGRTLRRDPTCRRPGTKIVLGALDAMDGGGATATGHGTVAGGYGYQGAGTGSSGF